ncbi:MAG: HEPN domain-containing protein [Deltaproteobacteria bacterium]|nr:HEPN domain-containing protein [Deltaproteobacteria bacterium]
MTNDDLAQSYFRKSQDRLDILDLLIGKGAYSDVVREAQEIVELSLKGMLRYAGIEPPKYHDVSPILLEHQKKFNKLSSTEIKRIAAISKKLRKERELAFYGDIDFIPTEEYTKKDAFEAMKSAQYVVSIAKRMMRNKR